MAFRVATHADHLYPRALENAGVDQRGTVGKRAYRGGWVDSDDKAALDSRFSGRALDE